MQTVDLNKVSLAQFRKAIAIMEQRDRLLNELEGIFSGNPYQRVACEGQSKTAVVLAAVAKAGKAGATVTDVVEATKMPSTVIHSILSKAACLRRVSRGCYAMREIKYAGGT